MTTTPTTLVRSLLIVADPCTARRTRGYQCTYRHRRAGASCVGIGGGGWGTGGAGIGGLWSGGLGIGGLKSPAAAYNPHSKRRGSDEESHTVRRGTVRVRVGGCTAALGAKGQETDGGECCHQVDFAVVADRDGRGQGPHLYHRLEDEGRRQGRRHRQRGEGWKGHHR